MGRQEIAGNLDLLVHLEALVRLVLAARLEEHLEPREVAEDQAFLVLLVFPDFLVCRALAEAGVVLLALLVLLEPAERRELEPLELLGCLVYLVLAVVVAGGPREPAEHLVPLERQERQERQVHRGLRVHLALAAEEGQVLLGHQE